MEPKYLGKQHSEAIDQIETVEWDSGDIVIQFDCSEFTSHCPVTGQPDFARLQIRYQPTDKIIETKSLKLYLMRYRHEAQFNEVLTCRICDDLYKQSGAKWMEVRGEFFVRGGISVSPVALRGDIG